MIASRREPRRSDSNGRRLVDHEVCQVVLYKNEAETSYLAFRVGETTKSVTDTYTGPSYQVNELNVPEACSHALAGARGACPHDRGTDTTAGRLRRGPTWRSAA
jgi:hypothetical protein